MTEERKTVWQYFLNKFVNKLKLTFSYFDDVEGVL